MYIPAIVTPLEINSNPIAPEKIYINKPNVKKTYKKTKNILVEYPRILEVKLNQELGM